MLSNFEMHAFTYLGASNIPKFFEFHLTEVPDANGTLVLQYTPTPMNEEPDYITFSSWWDELIVTGVIPLAALVVFNLRIYLKLRASDRQEYR